MAARGEPGDLNPDESGGTGAGQSKRLRFAPAQRHQQPYRVSSEPCESELESLGRRPVEPVRVVHRHQYGP
jgi:hypothetical protein